MEVCPSNLVPNLETMVCINECSEGDNYYWDNGDCYSCNAACLTCYGSSQEQCASCN